MRLSTVAAMAASLGGGKPAICDQAVAVHGDRVAGEPGFVFGRVDVGLVVGLEVAARAVGPGFQQAGAAAVAHLGCSFPGGGEDGVTSLPSTVLAGMP